jgi:hypothetical protein
MKRELKPPNQEKKSKQLREKYKGAQGNVRGYGHGEWNPEKRKNRNDKVEMKVDF